MFMKVRMGLFISKKMLFDPNFVSKKLTQIPFQKIIGTRKWGYIVFYVMF